MNVQLLKTFMDMLICSLHIEHLLPVKLGAHFTQAIRCPHGTNTVSAIFSSLMPILFYKGYIKHICRNCMNWNSILSCFYYFFWLAFRISIKISIHFQFFTASPFHLFFKMLTLNLYDLFQAIYSIICGAYF